MIYRTVRLVDDTAHTSPPRSRESQTNTNNERKSNENRERNDSLERHLFEQAS
jgi:hypothetical protein